MDQITLLIVAAMALVFALFAFWRAGWRSF
jgi:hypothetical protein